MFHEVHPDVYYPNDDPAVDILASKQTRARHRHEGKGCPYLKVGGRILYKGSDILAYLEANKIETAA